MGNPGGAAPVWEGGRKTEKKGGNGRERKNTESKRQQERVKGNYFEGERERERFMKHLKCT